jgi:hypothetical protein
MASWAVDTGGMTVDLSQLPPALELAALELDEPGRAAIAQAAETVDPWRFHLAILRLGRAVDMLERTRADWVDHGRPLVLEHANGSQAAHPLVKLQRDLEADVAAAARAVMLEPSTAERRAPGGQLGKPRSADRRADLTQPARKRSWPNEPPVVKLGPIGLAMQAEREADAAS